MDDVMDSNRIPLSIAAVRLRITRERLIRKVQSGEIAGGQEGGRWYIEREALAAATARTNASSQEPALSAHG